MDRLDIFILSALDKGKYKAQSKTIAELAAMFNAAAGGSAYSSYTIRRHIKALVAENMAAEGVMDSRSKTYYITDSGREYIKNIKENKLDGTER